MTQEEAARAMIIRGLNLLESQGEFCTFRTEEGWGTSLYSGREHYLSWDGHNWAWKTGRNN